MAIAYICLNLCQMLTYGFLAGVLVNTPEAAVGRVDDEVFLLNTLSNLQLRQLHKIYNTNMIYNIQGTQKRLLFRRFLFIQQFLQTVQKQQNKTYLTHLYVQCQKLQSQFVMNS